MKEYIKTHKKTLLLVFVFALLVFLTIEVSKILIPDEGAETYGTRLKEQDDYPIEESVYADIDEKVTKDVKKISHRVQGKIINFFITVEDKTSIEDAKKIGDIVIGAFDEKTLSYYSIQVYVLKDNKELNNFPIVGMKHPMSNKLVWTLDREITKPETEGESNEE